jgi:hypothetical protein
MRHYTTPTPGGTVSLRQDAPRSWRALITTRADGRRSVRGVATDSEADALRFIEQQEPAAAQQITRQIAAFSC